MEGVRRRQGKHRCQVKSSTDEESAVGTDASAQSSGGAGSPGVSDMEGTTVSSVRDDNTGTSA